MERDANLKLALPQKALFDLAYVSAVHGARPLHVPELELPSGFDRADLNRWLERIESPRLRTPTACRLRSVVSRSVR